MFRLWVWMGIAAAAWAQDNFVGAMGGIATLQAEATVEGSPPARFSGYKPENGPVLQVFAGRHFNDFFSLQGSYSWNRNSMVMSAADVNGASSIDRPMRANLHTWGLEGMAYFRPRSSGLRPYLSAGPTLLQAAADPTGPALVRGSPPRLPDLVRATELGLRVSVGIDWKLGEHFSLRYSFSEVIQRNPFGKALDPRGQRRLANFQNLWGVMWSF